MTIGTTSQAGSVGTVVVEEITIRRKTRDTVYGTLGSGSTGTTLGNAQCSG